MALNEEDLKFKLTVDPDTAKMQEAIKDIGKEIDTQAKQAKVSWDALGKAGAAQLESIKAQQKFTDAFAAPQVADVINLRAEQMVKITDEMNKQKELLARINVELDPKILRERVALEKQLADARADYVKAHGEESVVQGLTQKPSLLGSVTGSLQKGVGPAIGDALEAIGPVGIALTAVGAGAAVAVRGLKEMASTIAGFAGVASPGSLKQWELAVRDLQGVVGQTLVPVLHLMTDGMRLLGDILASILPNAREMEQILAPLREAFGDLSKEIREVLASIGSTVRSVVIHALKDLTTVLVLLAKSADLAARHLRDANPGLDLLLMGLEKLNGTDARSAQGAAARPGSIQTGEDYQRVNIEGALNSFAGESVPQKQLVVLQEIRDILRDSKYRSSSGGSFGPQSPSHPDPHGINRALGGGGFNPRPNVSFGMPGA